MFEVKNHVKDAHLSEVWALSWRRNKIMTGAVDGTIKVWNRDLELQHQLDASPLAIVSVSSNTQNVGVSTGLDGHIRAWNLESGVLLLDIDSGPGVNAWNIACQPGTGQVGTTGASGQIQIWDLNKGMKAGHYQTNSSFTTAISYSSDGKLVACGTKEGNVIVFDTTSGKVLHTLEAHFSPVRCLDFSHSGNLLFTGSDDMHINIFDPCVSSTSLFSLHPV
eukprot:TRINITY_DN2448_c0_g2_i2.p1 TRINITY_DN2448_c0_g2~~TRINITY_DN2448_c0_g2_i2.p1  ORF type:complete len:221 (+),score=34.44 TRINITY_DN2448_c0_g2_i2:62-724(+)